MMAKAGDFAKKLEKTTITFEQKATAKGKLYAAITEKQIEAELAKHLKFDLEKGMVTLEHPIKEIGSYEAKVQLTHEIHANVKIVVELKK